jgi:hypothetical protein
MVASYGIWSLSGLYYSARNEHLRELYPYQSMDLRVPEPRPMRGDAPPNSGSAERLTRLEEKTAGWRERNDRNVQLEEIHSRTVLHFVISPGFGFSRFPEPSEENLKTLEPGGESPAQPGPRPTIAWSPGLQDSLSDIDLASVGILQENSIMDFANPWRDGFIKDRRHVAGFESHRFSWVPDSNDPWKAPQAGKPLMVQTLDLVSLLLHDEPVAYVSDHLPKMDKLHGTPTRPLDRFESYGLETIRQGEDIVTARDGEVVRMLGAVRSARQCVACHGGERGDLLGAFSYTLNEAGVAVTPR